jgi:hypothetical protein
MRHYELVGLEEGVLMPKILPADYNEKDTPPPPREESFELQIETLESLADILRKAEQGTPKYQKVSQLLTNYDCPEAHGILLTDATLRNVPDPMEDRDPLTLIPKFEPKVIPFRQRQR